MCVEIIKVKNLFASVSGSIKMSHATIQTSREFGLAYLDIYGCKANGPTVAHARNILSFIRRGYRPLLPFLNTLPTYNGPSPICKNNAVSKIGRASCRERVCSYV